MNVLPTEIPGVLIIEPKVFGDERGFFLETFNAQRYADAGIPGPFVQDNYSRSGKGIAARAALPGAAAPGQAGVRWWPAPCSTWRWTSARARPPSASGWAWS